MDRLSKGIKNTTSVLWIGCILRFAMTICIVVASLPVFTIETQAANKVLTATEVADYMNKQVGKGYPDSSCLAFVADCFAAMGATRSSACCAFTYGNSHIQSENTDNIPVGADVFFGDCGGATTSSHRSNYGCSAEYFGHIGVYIGNNKFVHATGGKVQIGEMSSSYWGPRFRGWGIHGGVTISGADIPEPPAADTEAPVISGVHIFNQTSEGYFISCRVTDNVAVDRVTFATWTEANDQDDIIVPLGTLAGGVYLYQVKISDHNYETGPYVTHIYAYDAAGNSSNHRAGSISIAKNHWIPESNTTLAYQIESDGVHIVSCNYLQQNVSGNLVIPQKIEGMQVVAIENDVFYNCGGLTGVTIPAGIKKIGSMAFSGCTGLKNVTYEGYQWEWGAIQIGSMNEPLLNATFKCKADDVGPAISNVHIFNQTSEGYYISCRVNDLSGVQLVTFATWTEANGQDDIIVPQIASNDGTYVYQVKISDHDNETGEYVTHIYAYDSEGNTSNYRIGDIPIAQDYSVPGTNITLAYLTEEDGVHIVSCNSLKQNADGELIIPEQISGIQVVAIENDVFYNCSKLTSVTIPHGVKVIGKLAFQSCSGLVHVTLPGTISEIGKLAFAGCAALSTVTYYGNQNQWAAIQMGDSNEPLQNASITYKWDLEAPIISSVHIFNQTNEGYYISCKITDNDLVDLVTFATWTENNGQDDIIVPHIEEEGGIYLYQVKIADHNDETGKYVTHIYAYDASGNVSDYRVGSIPIAKNYRIPNTSVILAYMEEEDGVHIVSCNNLQQNVAGELVIPEQINGRQVIAIENDVFYNCRHLTGVTIPHGVKEIGKLAFQYCERLKYVTLPNTITSIGRAAFEGCTGLSTINYAGTQAQWNAVQIGSTNDFVKKAKKNFGLHIWDDGETIAQPTCTEDGKAKYTCTDCGLTKIETLLTKGHSYKSMVIRPTCTTAGYTTHSCSVCGSTYTDATINANGHNFSKWNKEDGENHVRRCSDCSAVQRQDHLWENGACTVCVTAGVSVGYMAGTLTVSVPGVQSDCQIIIGCYNAQGQQVALFCPEQPVRETVWLETSVAEQPVVVKVFYLDTGWHPVGPAFEHAF